MNERSSLLLQVECCKIIAQQDVSLLPAGPQLLVDSTLSPTGRPAQPCATCLCFALLCHRLRRRLLLLLPPPLHELQAHHPAAEHRLAA